jgi:hypothetical protein
MPIVSNPIIFQFWSDTNQSLFEDTLDEAGVRFERTQDVGEVVVEDGDKWIDLASEYGAECS